MSRPLPQSKAALVQARAQTASARGHYATAVATLRSDYDALNKTVSVAPFNGIVTNMPVREGETVVVGIQNAEGSTLMTLADMSVITAEVKVDETDIVNVAIGQPVDVTVDALPGTVFRGHVAEVGDQAILRSTGIATSQSTTGTEEAKDFKVVVNIDNPSDDLRPGLSTTAKITTARRAERARDSDPSPDLACSPNRRSGCGASGERALHLRRRRPRRVSSCCAASSGKLKARFVPVRTGITGATDIEVTRGLGPEDEIVIGSYTTLRTLKNGAKVKRDSGTRGRIKRRIFLS